MSEHELLIRIDERMETVQKTVEKHETRIGNLEVGFIKVLGIGSLIGLITGFFGGKLGGTN